MLRLVLLGSLRLEDDEGPLTGRASQKRRLAILALLAVPPGHLVTRDKLIGYLWPDTDDERARRSLSTALWELRRELGEETIQTPGDEIGLDPDLITSDGAAFMEAVEDGELERAVELYGGPFLDGVHIGASAEFEHWVDEERRRYAWKYRETLEKLARRKEAKGDLQGAVGVWSRLASEDRLNKRVALGYMNALWAVGDGARALKFVDVHAALLREELDAEPDPEVLALAERIRQEPAPTPAPPPPAPPAAEPPVPEPAVPDPPSPQPPVPTPTPTPPPVPEPLDRPTASRRVAVAIAVAVIAAIIVVAAVVRGGSDDPAEPTGPRRMAVLPIQDPTDTTGMVDFAGDLAEAISGALGQVEGFLLTGRTTIKALQNLDARQIADSLGLDYLLGGDIAREDDRLRIRVWVVDDNDTQKWQDQYDRPLGNLMELEQEIAELVVAAVAERLAGIETGEEDLFIGATTDDTAALRHFRAARRAWNTRTPTGLVTAREELERAVASDPSYARAYAALADVFNTMGAYEYGMLPPDSAYPLAQEAAQTALDIERGLPEAMAALGVVQFNHDWNWDGAERLLRAAIDSLPSEVMPRHWYASLLRATGRRAEAVRQVLYAQERDPESAVVSTSLCRHYYFDGNLARSAAACEDALGLDPGHVMAYLALGLTRVRQGDDQAALRLYAQADSLIGRPAPLVSGLRAHALGAAGDTAAADTIYQRLRREAASGAADRYVPPQFVAIAAIGAGRLEEAVEWLNRGLEERSPALIYMQIEPVIEPLWELPSYRELVERAEAAGLPPVRRASSDG